MDSCVAIANSASHDQARACGEGGREVRDSVWRGRAYIESILRLVVEKLSFTSKRCGIVKTVRLLVKLQNLKRELKGALGPGIYTHYTSK